MMILRSVLIVVEALCSILLIALVLLQKSKNEGLGLAFGSGTGETLFGSRAGNVLTRATIILGIVFLLNTLFLAVVYSGAKDRSLMEKALGPRQTAPAQQAPAARPATTPSEDVGGAPTLPGADLGSPAPMPVTEEQTAE